MALSSDQKFQILDLLGLPAKTIIETSTHYSSLIAAKFENLGTDAEDIVSGYLDSLAALEAKRLASYTRQGVKSVGDIEFFGDGLSKFESERNQIVKKLARFLDLPYRGSGSNVSVCL